MCVAAELFLCFALCGHERRILKAREFSDEQLAAVFCAEEMVLGAAEVFTASLAVSAEQDFVAAHAGESARNGEVTGEFKLRDGVGAVGFSGIAYDEDEFVVGDAGLAPAEVVVEVRGLAIFVGAEDADVEVEARVFEVVGVSAEEGDAFLG